MSQNGTLRLEERSEMSPPEEDAVEVVQGAYVLFADGADKLDKTGVTS